MKSLMNMRPFQLILLIIFGLLALVGLYLFSTYSGFGGSAQKVGTVVIWGTLPANAVQAELAQIQAADKSYAKVTYSQHPAESFDSDLANAIAAQNGPDLILINQEQLLADANKLNVIPFSNALPQRTYLNTYLPEDALYMTTNGTYGIPYTLDPLVLYYNKSILTSAGVPTPPETWEAVTGLAPTLTKLSAAQGVSQSTIPFGTYTNVQDARGILSLLLLQSGSPITQSSSGIVQSVLGSGIQQADGATPAASALNFYTQFSDPTRTVYTWNGSIPSDQQAFIAGNLVFYIGYASELPTLKAENPNLNFDMALIPQPQTASQKVDYGLAYAFAIPKASKNSSGALAAALMLANKQYVPAAAQALTMVPSQRGLLATSPTDQYGPIYYPLALISQGWLSPAPATIDSIFSAMITNITSGRMTVQGAVSAASQALTAALPTSSS